MASNVKLKVIQLISVAFLSILASYTLIRIQGSLTLGELLLVSLSVCLFLVVFTSFTKSPRQFLNALLERVKYTVTVPMAVIFLICFFTLKLTFLIIKGAIIPLLIWVIYLISPIDIIPDIIPIVGMIDDVVLFFSIIMWSLSSSVSEAVQDKIRISRPTTSFP